VIIQKFGHHPLLRNPYGYAYIHTYSHSNTYRTYPDSYSKSNGYTDRNTNTYGYSNSVANTASFTNAYTYRYSGIL
jgi:hypothetical protein